MISELLTIGPEALAQMRERGGNWAAYVNIAMDSAGLGTLQFLQFGAGCTFAEPPARCPDTHLGTGWKFQFAGIVDLTSGKIIESTEAS